MLPASLHQMHPKQWSCLPDRPDVRSVLQFLASWVYTLHSLSSSRPSCARRQSPRDSLRSRNAVADTDAELTIHSILERSFLTTTKYSTPNPIVPAAPVYVKKKPKKSGGCRCGENAQGDLPLVIQTNSSPKEARFFRGKKKGKERESS